jgi:proline dehydrogenase
MVTTLPVSRRLVDRFVAGERLDDAVDTTRDLLTAGLEVTIDHLGEDTLDIRQAADTRDAYLALLDVLSGFALTPDAEVSVKLSALGQALPGDVHRVALDNAGAICAAAQRAGTTVTLDMEDHTTVDSTLEILRELRHDFATVGLHGYWRGLEWQTAVIHGSGDIEPLLNGDSRETHLLLRVAKAFRLK